MSAAPTPEPPSEFFDVMNKSRLAVSKKAAGAGVIGLVGFFLFIAISAVFFITENFFIALFGASLALLIYATGAEIGKLLLSTVTMFFSSRHLTPKAAQLLELLLRKPGQLVRRAAIEDALWPDSQPQADALRSQIHSLRKALAEHGFDGVETVHGVGLRLVARGRNGA